MATAASLAGLSSGIQSELANARRRRIEDRQLAQRDQQLQQQNERNQLGLADARFRLGREQINAHRADQQYAQQQTDLHRRAEQEGLQQLVRSLQAGVDPQYAMSQYNRVGAHKIQSIQYDPTTSRIRMVSPDGNGFDGKLSQLATAIGVTPAAPIKLGKDDRLIDPTTGKAIVGPSAGRYISSDKPIYDSATGKWIEPPGIGLAGARSAASGIGGTRKLSSYNPESFQQNISRSIAQANGGQLGPLGTITGIADPDARQIATYQSALGEQVEGMFRNYAEAGLLTPDSIADAVLQATKGMKSDGQIEKEARDKLDTFFHDPTDQEVADRVEVERMKQRSAAEARLWGRVSKMIARPRSGASAPPRIGTVEDGYRYKGGDPSVPANWESASAERSMFKRPAWAGAAVPPSELVDHQGNALSLHPDHEYDVNLNGKRTTIRMAPDGQVYEVAGKDSTAAQATEGLAAARRPAVQPRATAAAQETPRVSPPAFHTSRPSLEPNASTLAALDRERAASPFRPTFADKRERAEIGSEAMINEARTESRSADIFNAAQSFMRDQRRGRKFDRDDVRTLVAATDGELHSAGLGPDQIKHVRELGNLESAHLGGLDVGKLHDLGMTDAEIDEIKNAAGALAEARRNRTPEYAR